MSILRHTFILSTLVLLGACSSKLPPSITESIEGAPTIAEVRQSPERFLSTQVRWGGVIVQTENKTENSEITIVAFNLSGKGRPEPSDNSTGRFIARIDGFVEPQVYNRHREITIVGTIEPLQTQKVGEFDYDHPVIQVTSYHLWPERIERVEPHYPSHWYYDPWYRPYHPYFYPYRKPSTIQRQIKDNKVVK